MIVLVLFSILFDFSSIDDFILFVALAKVSTASEKVLSLDFICLLRAFIWS